MRLFKVRVTVQDPYPKQFEYNERSNKVETAVHRAILRFREEEMKGRPVNEITVWALASMISKINKTHEKHKKDEEDK